MIKVPSFTILLFFSSFVLAEENDGNLYLQYCPNILKTPESLTNEEFGAAMFCLGALHGIDGMQQVEKIKGRSPLYCPPHGYGVKQGARIAIKYLEDNPQNLHLSGSSLLIKALH